MIRGLRHGYTTGACAAAAAKGAALMLRDQQLAAQAELLLPGGEAVVFPLHGQEFSAREAACHVVKDAGDDPDITNGARIHARVSWREPEAGGGRPLIIEGGPGVGKVTKPGLAVPVGEWAINPVPRRMIAEAVLAVLPRSRCIPCVTISVPDGEQLAHKTLNGRLGIVGGLSILGTTGIVRPISTHAWTATIDAAIDVALACGGTTIVLSTGRSSELVAQHHLGLPEESHIMMGDHVGHALRSCAARGVRSLVLAGQFAKLLKIACGHEQTHVSSSKLDLQALADWTLVATGDPVLAGAVGAANTAREVLGQEEAAALLTPLVCTRARDFAARLVPGATVKVLLAGYRGEVLYFG